MRTDTHSTAISRFGWLWALPVLGLMMILLVLSATPWGLGVTPDSMHYISAATSFHRGEGLAGFSSTWPPLYPVSISLAMWLHDDVLASARGLNAALAAANIALLMGMSRRLGWRAAVSNLFILLVALQAGFLHSHFLLWSEALFLCLLLLDLLLLSRILSSPASYKAWTALVIVAACAMLTRYAGLFLVPLHAAILLFFLNRPFRTRVTSTIFLSVASMLPLIGWILFNRSRGVSGVNLSLGWHPPDAAHIESLGQTISVWFGLPLGWGLPVFFTILCGATLALVAAALDRSKRDPALHLIAAFVVSYAAFLALSISVANHYIPLDERILFPMFPMVWLLLLSSGMRLQHRFVRALAMAVLSIILIRGAFHGWEDWRDTRSNGLGLTTRQIREMPVLDWLRTIPAEIPAVSNGPDLFSLYLHRPSEMFPPTYNPTSLAQDEDALAKLEAITVGPTLVVHFQVMAFRTYLPGPDILETLPDMRVVYRGPDAIAWIRNAGQPVPKATR